MKKFTSKNQKLGKFGEDIALDFLINRNFSIVERNFTKPYGEIDIIAKIGNTFHFIEVKTLVKHKKMYHPFENANSYKIRKMHRVISFYLESIGVSHETRWVIDVIAVVIDVPKKHAKLEVLWNIT